MLTDTSRSFFLCWAGSQCCFLFLNERHVVLIEPVVTGSKLLNSSKATRTSIGFFALSMSDCTSQKA